MDTKEISAFQALKSQKGNQAAVEVLVREQLLARYQATAKAAYQEFLHMIAEIGRRIN